MKRVIVTSLFLFLSIYAKWQNPTPIYVGPGDQTINMVISDGAGGAAVLWHDSETGWEFMNVIDSAGNLKWGSGGVAVVVMGDTTTQNPDMFRDSLGNYWVALEAHWYTPSESKDIYVQKLSPTGQRLFGDRGVAVCTAEGTQTFAKLCYSGEGAIVVWMDERDALDYRNYSQRVSSEGITLWENDGMPISDSPYGWFANCVSDGVNGAFYIFRQWIDSQNHIALQRLDSLGSRMWGDSGIYYGVGKIWTESGFLCGHMNEVEDSGFIFFYESGGYYRTNRVNSFGIMQWDTSEVILGNDNDHYFGNVSRLPSGDWYIVRGSGIALPFEGVYAHIVTLDGETPLDDTGRSVWNKWAYNPRSYIIPDVTEEGIIAWRDIYDEGDPSGNKYIEQGIMAQRIDNSGNILWPEEVHVAGIQGLSPQVVGTFDKAGVIAWNDNRNGNLDVYTTRIDSLGNLPPGIEEQPVLQSPAELEVFSSVALGSLLLRYSTSPSEPGTLKLFDASGRMVKSLSVRGQGEVKVSGLSAGVYFARLESGGAGVTKKIVVVR